MNRDAIIELNNHILNIEKTKKNKKLSDEEIENIMNNDLISKLLDNMFESHEQPVDLKFLKKMNISENSYNILFKYLIDNNYYILEDDSNSDLNIINCYLKDISFYPLLSDEKQTECFNKHYEYLSKTIEYKNTIINQYGIILKAIADKHSNNDRDKYNNIIKYEVKILNKLIDDKKELSNQEIKSYLINKVKNNNNNIYVRKYELENLNYNFNDNILLSDEELHNLYIKLFKNEEERIKIKKYIAEHNVRLVLSIAREYSNNGMTYEDCVQEGNIGLLRAIDKFNPKLNNKFSTYAKWWIMQSITRAITDKSRKIRIPVHFYGKITKYNQFCNKYMKENQKVPSDNEIMNQLNLSKEELNEIKFYLKDASSLNEYVGEEEHGTHAEVGDSIEDEKNNIEDNILKKQLRKDLLEVLEKIKDNEKIVLLLRFGIIPDKPMLIVHQNIIFLLTSDHINEENIKEYLIKNNFEYIIKFLSTDLYKFKYIFLDGKEKTLEEVGELFGVTRERIRQVEKKSLIKIHKSEYSKRINYFNN